MDSRTITIINNIQQLEIINGQVEQLGDEWGFSPKLTMHFNLVLEEILSNIIFYGYKDTEKHSIEIHFQKEGSRIVIQIQDDAIAFDPLTADAPNLNTKADQREIGGLGIHFIRELMDEVYYERKNGKNLLTVVKMM